MTGVKLKRNKLKNLLKFLILFNLFSIPMYLIIILNVQFYALQLLTANLVSITLNFSGVSSELNDLLISVPVRDGYFAGSIDWDCTGWKSVLAFFALVFATEAPIKKKLYGLIFVPMIYVINILRVSFVFYFVSAYDVNYFELIHSFLWSFGMILVVLFLWIIWLKYFKVFEKKY